LNQSIDRNIQPRLHSEFETSTSGRTESTITAALPAASRLERCAALRYSIARISVTAAIALRMALNPILREFLLVEDNKITINI
jgi:hypothetical protein